MAAQWLAAFVLLAFSPSALCNPHAKRLYDDLLSEYNQGMSLNEFAFHFEGLIRPVTNNSEKLTVKLGLKLSQLMDVDLKNQIMTTNVWVEQNWRDYKLVWDPDDYGGVDELFVPSQNIWLPDIVLFNNADGKYEVTLMTKASVKHTGDVVWKPPAIYKSSCKINVEWFPFDEQNCDMKFGSWTYDGHQLDLKHVDQVRGSNIVNLGIDLTEFYLSVEWDILGVPATRNEEYYIPQSKALILEERAALEAAGDEASLKQLEEEEDQYKDYQGQLLTDITFYIRLRRKTLFYTVNLIIPCVGISFLTVLVFYLPSDSGEKVTLCISILISLTVFFLLLAEIIPPTSLAVPLLGKYLLFTMILVTMSISVTVTILNIHFRSPTTHRMSPWVKKVFIDIMPVILCMQRPNYVPRYSVELPEKLPDEEEDEDNEHGCCSQNMCSHHCCCCSGGGGSRRTSFSRQNGHIMSGDEEYDAGTLTSCTSRCHHHPHLDSPSPSPSPTGHCHHHQRHHHHHHHHHHRRRRHHRCQSTAPPSCGRCDGGGRRPNGSLPHSRVSTLKSQKSLDMDHKKNRKGSKEDESQRASNGQRGSGGNGGARRRRRRPPLGQVAGALKGVEFIAQHIKKADKDREVIEDWKFIAMVLDRLFLFLFMAGCLGGTGGIILRAPSLYDTRKPIGATHSLIYARD